MSTITGWIRDHRALSAAIGVIGAVVVGVLAFGVFGVHTLFVDDVVVEEDPFAAGPGASGLAGDEMSSELAADMNEAMVDAPAAATVEEPMPMEPTGPGTLLTGTLSDRSHPASGDVLVVTDGERRVLRFEDLATDNGPDLNVYLSAAPADAPADELGADIVDLGDLKGNIGDQNYDIPDDVDLDRYRTVVIWCVRFRVVFGAGDLA